MIDYRRPTVILPYSCLNRNQPICREEVIEDVSGVDIRRQTQPQHRRVLTVHEEGPIYDIDKEVQISCVSQVAGHTLHHTVHQRHPRILVQLVNAATFLSNDTDHMTQGSRV